MSLSLPYRQLKRLGYEVVAVTARGYEIRPINWAHYGLTKDLVESVYSAVIDYLGLAGTAEEKEIDVQIVPDPEVEGTYAIQVEGEEPIVFGQFLVTSVKNDRISAADLEDVEFVTWPPRRRAL